MNTIQEMIQDADMLLIGIGDEFSLKKASKEEIIQAYQALQALIKGKPWFLITLNTDDLVFDSGFSEFFVVAPCGSERNHNVVTDPDYDESWYLPQWNSYMNYLTATLGKKLLILEFGVGLSYPSVIRMPFEKTIQMNQKSKLFRVHSKLSFVPEEIEDQSVLISEHPVNYLINLNKNS